jgi:putative hydrolase of HD superfamily
MTQTINTRNRADTLIHLSDRIYDAIDTEVDGETRSRRIVTLGVNVVAQMLETSYSHRFPGDHYHQLLVNEMAHGGLTISDRAYDAWPRYKTIVAELPSRPIMVPVDQTLVDLSSQYADVQRATQARDGLYETDARHAAHLSALALPYAAELYPELDQAKIALYCLLHDIVEAYAGDVPSLNMSIEVMRAKQTAEAAAIQQLTREFGDTYPQFVKFVHDYEELTDNEARFVKTFDKLDPSFTQAANGGITLTRDYGIRSAREYLRGIDASTVRMRSYAQDFPEVMADRQELNHRVAEMTDWPE